MDAIVVCCLSVFLPWRGFQTCKSAHNPFAVLLCRNGDTAAPKWERLVKKKKKKCTNEAWP